MSVYDIAVGLTHQTLDKGVGQLYQDPTAREKLFKGTQTIDSEDHKSSYDVSYDIQEAPTFVLSPPDATTWKQSIDGNGKNPTAANPPSNTIQLVFPKFWGSYKTSTTNTPHSGTTRVIAIVSVSMQGHSLQLTPVSIWLDETKLTGWTKLILNNILKMTLGMVQKMMTGISIPPLSFNDVTIELTDPVVALTQDLLVMAASQKSKGHVDISGVKWPQQDLFVLISQDVLKVVTDLVAQKIAGYEKKDSGTQDKVFDWDYDFTITRAELDFQADMTKIHASIGYTFTGEVKPLGIGGPCSVTAASKAL